MAQAFKQQPWHQGLAVFKREGAQAWLIEGQGACLDAACVQASAQQASKQQASFVGLWRPDWCLLHAGPYLASAALCTSLQVFVTSHIEHFVRSVGLQAA